MLTLALVLLAAAPDRAAVPDSGWRRIDPPALTVSGSAPPGAMGLGLRAGMGSSLGFPIVTHGSKLVMLNATADFGGQKWVSAVLDVPSQQWSPPAPMPPLRFGGKPLTTPIDSGDALYLIGGEDGYYDAAFPVATRYSFRDNAWQSLAAVGIPSRRLSFAAALVAGRLVVWGGERTAFWSQKKDPEVLGDGGAYDPVTKQWTPISAQGAPSPRAASGVAVGNELFIYRGTVSAACFRGSGDSSACVPADDSFLFDPVKNRWRPASMVGAPPKGVLAGSVGTRAVVFTPPFVGAAFDGGIFDAATNRWTPLPPLRDPDRFRDWQRMLKPLWIDGRLVLLPRCNDGDAKPTSAAVLDPLAPRWSEVSLPPEACSATVALGPRSLLLVDLSPYGATLRAHSAWELTPATLALRSAELGSHEALRSHGSVYWTGEWLVILGGYVDVPNPCAGGPVGGLGCDPPGPPGRDDGWALRPTFSR